MSNFNIRINGAANLSQAKTEFAKLTAQVNALNASMAANVQVANGVNPRGYERMTQAVKGYSQTWRNAAASTGSFEVQQLRVNSATEEYTKLIEKQKLSFRQWHSERNRLSKAAYREQLALRSMVVQQMPGTVGGKKVLDIAIPNEVHKSYDTLGNKIGWIREELKSASTQMVNWGKNTQWAGRQLMVGFTMPTLAFGAATGVLAYQVDKEMTRIQKVYDTTAQVIAGDAQSMIRVEEELARVRVDSMNTARNAASEYGQAVTDTLKVQADLAATGLKGLGLQEATLSTMRISTLGELDMDTATNMTVALQSAFRDTIKTSEDLSRAFDFMNATENATSLSIDDIAQALPRAGSAMAALGVSVQEMTVLMTSMKEAGVDAAEGANALKSATGSILKPSPAADEFIQQISDGQVQVTALAEMSGGNLYKALEQLFTMMKNAGLDATKQQQVLVSLFGKYQYNRIAGILNNYGGALDGVQNQTSRAMELMGEDWETLADLSDREIGRIQDSLSGRFRSALESVKIELAEMGAPFLEIGVSVLGVIEKIVKGFNSMPDGLKKAVAATAIGAAILGPLVMLTGLTANFAGNMLKMGVAVTGLFVKFKLLNKESAAAALAAEMASVGWTTQQAAAAKLTNEIKLLTQAHMEAARVQNAIYGQGRGGGTTPASAAQPNVSPGGVILPAGIGVTGPVVTDEDENNAKKTSKWMAAGAVSAGVTSAAFAATMISSNETVDSIAKWAMIASMTAPLLSGMVAGMSALGPHLTKGLGKAGGLMSKIKAEAILATIGMSKFNLSAKSAGGFLKAGLGSVLAMVSPAGWIGIALGTAAGAAYLLHKNAQSAAEEIKKMYNDAEGLGKILEYSPSSDGLVHTLDEAGNSIVGMQSKANAFEKEYGYITDKIANASDEQEAFNYAMSQGLKVINTGGTAEQAREAVEVALRSAKTEAETERILLRFKAELDFTNAANLVSLNVAQIEQQMDDALGTLFKQKGFWEDLVPYGDETSQFVNAGIELAKQAGTVAGEAWVTAYDSEMDTAPIADAAQKQLDKFNEILAGDASDRDKEIALRARAAFLQSLVAGQVDNAEELVAAQEAGVTVAELMAEAGMVITGELGASADAADDLAGNISGATRETDKLARAQARYNRALKEAEAVDLADMVRGAMQETQGALSDIASDNFDDQMNDALDSYREGQEARMDTLNASQEAASNAMDARHEREVNAFEDRWERRKEAVEDAFDARIERVENAIEAEQKAEEIRQRIFDAEIQRMQRMAEMANTNIDFNVAINAGDLDEAAKIRNDMMARETEWALGDAGDKSSRQSERRQKRLEKKQDRLEDLKDKRLEAIQAAEEAERESLERRQAREQAFLEQQQAMREAALQEEIENNIAAQEEIWENRKEKLDRAIELFQAYVPKNEKDLREHVARISDRYTDFNVATKDKFNKTAVDIGDMLTQNVKDSAREIKDEIQWATVGDKIARDMIRGAFGMSPEQFQNWLVTGKWPKGADISAPDYSGSMGMAHERSNAESRLKYHTGGIVGVDKGGSAGIRSGHHDEVDATLLRGEGVLNRKAMSQIGPTGFRSLNSGQMPYGSDAKQNTFGTGGGGSMAGLGLAGIMGAMMYRAMGNSIQQAAINGGIAREQRNARQASKFGGTFAAGAPGMYSDRYFSAAQLKNAATIASVGRSMGMSARDIQIGIMTAITESGLINVNYGDRDSLGLFQQRPSMGWGTPAQVTNPEYAAGKFFSTLKGVVNRGDMSPWLAAQAVQRSFDPTGSNYQQYWDNAQAIFKGLSASAATGGYVSGSGGWRKPSVPGKGWVNTHDYRNAIGSPLYAVSDGVITESRAITSGGSPGNGLYSTPYRSYGETIAMRTASGDIFRYAHLSPGARYVTPGQRVKGGSLIGRSGNTGNSSGPHTHFDVNGDYNASGWLAGKGVALSKGAMNIKWDNTVANLHKGEAVLTEDINRQFREGVRKFAEGPNAQYNLHMSVKGADINVDELVDKTMTAFRRMELRRPQSRSGS